MKILQAIPAFHPSWGGPLTLVKNVSKGLQEKGYSVEIVTSNYGMGNQTSRMWNIDGLKVHAFRNIRFPMKKTSKLLISLDMWQFIRHKIKQYDIVHIQGFRTFQNIIINRKAREFRIPFVIQAHGSLPRDRNSLKMIFDRFFGFKSLTASSKAVALTPYEVTEYMRMHVPRNKIEIIPNGIKITNFLNLPHPSDFKRKFGIPDDKSVILYLGRIHRRKGIDVLLKAYAALKNKDLHKNSILVIIGPDDGYLNHAKLLSSSLGISDSIFFTGYVSSKDKLGAYSACDIFVVPSLSEPFGIVILEAMASGKPIIATRAGGVPYIIPDGKAGFLVQPNDVDALAHAIGNLLHEPKLCIKMGIFGRKHVQKYYTLDKIISQVESLYRELV